ncbi:hypothetical protein GCM10025868_30720 [Angustibacter aerolatus]|uniref:RNA polymerase sigma factor 70 region 4 type 2 domain-containing protein n=1 Tax=Angustibacter aerolatus TaxID=1162965 RepID=A0ABQ6JHW2_9ACTN|nr:hypothetical protein GCM10025868_30720 [Angustibacter aerolatus]
MLARLRDERLLDAVRRLRPEQQECLSLRFLQGLSLAETAEVLGRSTGAVKQARRAPSAPCTARLGGEAP